MADKELRSMNRTELIEIIYALQQEERALRAENEQLRRQLEDKILRMEKVGSIAEAALSLNHIFEDADAAARQYLDSLKALNESADPQETPSRPEAADVTTNIQQAATECLASQEEAGQDTFDQKNGQSPNKVLRICSRLWTAKKKEE
ncbi:MAG: hypothetical protein LUD78_00010 [Clostridiales bacterium]|nr:hypothetical protein [Clostridiales bacterium]